MGSIGRASGLYSLGLPSQGELFGMLARIDQALVVARGLRRCFGYVPSQGQVVIHGRSRFGIEIAVRTAQRAVKVVATEPEESEE